jgi:hypothetical protein
LQNSLLGFLDFPSSMLVVYWLPFPVKEENPMNVPVVFVVEEEKLPLNGRQLRSNMFGA